MTLQELYASVGGNYESALRILQMDKLITKFIARLPQDFRPGKSRTMADEQLDSHMEQLRAKYEETVAAIQKFTQG